MLYFPDQLKRIDLTGNQISAIEEDALRSLSQLQELLLADNRIQTLPELPKTIKHLDVSNNQLKSARLHDEAFKVRRKGELLESLCLARDICLSSIHLTLWYKCFVKSINLVL